MTPMEQFNNDVWYVLQVIKEASLYVVKGEPIEYTINTNFLIFSNKVPNAEKQLKILKKLQEWDAIKFITEDLPNNVALLDVLTIQFCLKPKFDKIHQKYKKRVIEPAKNIEEKDKLSKITEIVKQKQEIPETQRPYCVAENNIGYLKFGKHGEKIEIGGANNQPFRLLQCLTEPFGIAKSVEIVFEAIREGVKKKNKSGVYTSEMDKGKKVELIEYVIKELQKGKKLKGKLEFKWDDLKTKLWLEYIP
jgi:hypothetical protein